MDNNQSVAPVSVAPAVSPAQSPETKVVGVMAFAGLFFLFSLPLIGWLICIIVAVVAKNKNISHFAAGYIVLKLILILLFLIALAIIIPILIKNAINIVEDIFGSFKDLPFINGEEGTGGLDFGGILDGIMSGSGGFDMESIIGGLKNNLVVDVSGIDLSKYGVSEEDIRGLDLSSVTVEELENILPEGVDVNDILEEAGVSDDIESSLFDYFKGFIGACLVRTLA